MWKQIPVYDGRYSINESGQIYNSVRKAYLRPNVSSNGYYTVKLPITPGHPKKFWLHRLVAMAFLPNPDNLPVVMHLDNNPLNCHVSNLKWATYSENNAAAIRDGLNVVPRPDNRKLYTIYEETCPVMVDCYGVKQVIGEIGFGTDTCIRNYIFRQSRIPIGPYEGWKIQLASKIPGWTFNDHPMTWEGIVP